MKKISEIFALSVIASLATSTGSVVHAKSRTASFFKPRTQEVGYKKDITGEASLTIKQKIILSPEIESFQFQDGKLAENVEFYRSPRCYLHFRKEQLNQRELDPQMLKVSKIDNVYTKGSVHVTFWFDKDPTISDLLCITNYNHTLNATEIRSTLGNAFQVSLSKSVEKDALFNIVPNKNAPVPSETAAANGPNNSVQLILSDS